MRKSRLSLFKSTSFLISVFGIIMIILLIAVVGYVGFSIVSSSINNKISSGIQYDELASLNSIYDDLENNFTSIRHHFEGNSTLMNRYDQALLELSKAHQAIDSINSALSSGKSTFDVDARIKLAKEKLKIAQEAYQSLL